MVFLLVALLAGPDQGALDPGIWDIGVDAQRDIFDAVYVRNEVHFSDTRITYRRVVRILSDAGRSAVNLAVYDGMQELEGRVTTRDGREIPFSADDLIETLAIKVRRQTVSRKMLIPPGLTRDCVVTYSYYQEAKNGMPTNISRVYLPIAEENYIQTSVVTVDKALFAENSKESSYNFDLYTQAGVAPTEFTATEDADQKVLTWTHIPPRRAQPYGNAKRDPAAPFVYLGWIRNYAPEGSLLEYWAEAARENLFAYVGVMESRPKPYKALLEGLKRDMPQDPDKAMALIVGRFHDAVQDLGFHPPELEPPDAAYNTWGMSLGARISRGYKTGWAAHDIIAFMFYKLLEDLEIPFSVLVAPDLDESAFVPEERNAGVLNWLDLIFAYQVGDELHYLMPQMRQYPVGTLYTRYRNVNCLAVDVKNKYLTFRTLPGDSAANHTEKHDYALTLAPDGSLTMDLTLHTTGYLQAAWRYGLYDLKRDDQEAYIKDRFEDRLSRDWKITNVSCLHAYDLHQPVVIKVQAERKGDPDRQGLVFLPFPATVANVRSPAFYPAVRTQHIYLPQPALQEDTCRITVPEGYVLRGDNRWGHENGFGRVAFQAYQEGTTVTARRMVAHLPQVADKKWAQDLKAYLEWVDAAYADELLLVKEAAQ